MIYIEFDNVLYITSVEVKVDGSEGKQTVQLGDSKWFKTTENERSMKVEGSQTEIGRSKITVNERYKATESGQS